MGDHIKRLTLIDAEKFNSRMELLEHTAKRKKIVDDAKQSCEEAELVHSYKDMMSSVEILISWYRHCKLFK
jgi:predicted DNA-binding protein YlxM (UPF0122 family)